MKTKHFENRQIDCGFYTCYGYPLLFVCYNGKLFVVVADCE